MHMVGRHSQTEETPELLFQHEPGPEGNTETRGTIGAPFVI